MMHRRRQSAFLAAGLLGSVLSVSAPAAVNAQIRAETLRQVTGGMINTLDPTAPGATRESFGLSMSTYDRLFAFERKKVGEGWIFDLNTIRGELAEGYKISDDGLKITVTLRKDVTFQDGSPVTADDVKWSLDRAVTAKSLAGPQLTTGSLDKADQFKVIDPLTIEISLPKPDRLAMPNLAVVYPIIINSKVAKQHATTEDPWAQAWLKENTAGSGAYSIESWKPGEQVVLKRNESWKSGRDGKLAFFKRVITQTVPEAATRANLVERGDADLSVDLPSSDVPGLMERGKVKVVSTPQFNALVLIVFATRIPPFDNKKVRQAVAAALPYSDMFKGALFGRGNPLQDASWTGEPTEAKFPQNMPVKTDLAKAKQLLTEAGYPNGFETTFSFNVGSAATAEPMAALIKESLLKIGVKVDIQKQPDAQMSTSVTEKKLPFFTESIISWIPAPDYYFRNFFTGEQRWNYSSWNNAEINSLSQAARFEPNQAKYDEITKKMVAIEADETPVVLLWQPNQDAVMVPSIEDYTYQFHRQVDFRDMRRK